MDDLNPEIDFAFLRENDVLIYNKMALEKSKKLKNKPLSEVFKNSNTDLFNLIKDMLQYNHHLRPPAHILLKHKVFDSIRDKANENIKAPIAKLDIDMNEYKRDYEKYSDREGTLDYILKSIRALSK
jgi:serine/threonine protein kinase